MMSLTEEQSMRLREALKPLHEQFDPQWQLLQCPLHSPGYHTTLTGGMTHPTRESLGYAVALLDTGEEELRQRAESILRRILSLQDQDPSSKTYGIWSWFADEPLTQMSPPDWNWADFCGTQLLEVAINHAASVAPDILAQVHRAIGHAAIAIQRRNVGPGYTNIAIMGAFVTLVGGELLGQEDIRRYGIQRLARFYDYTIEQGGFSEYNSPTYTIVALNELLRLRKYVKDSASRKLLDRLYHIAWEEIAQHFHVPTRQWAGPHSRCYSTLLGTGVLALIQRATGSRVRLLDGGVPPTIDEHRLVHQCPDDLEPLFAKLERPRECVKSFTKGARPLIGTTWLTPQFALGSINRGYFWNQARALVGYWGSTQQPAYLHLRCLHNGYDFCAARFRSVQHEGSILGAINFATDAGDTHPNLDMLREGTIRARDLRLRFELGGAAAGVQLAAPGSVGEPIDIDLGGLFLQIHVPHAAFGDYPFRWEHSADAEIAALDLVLYSGPETSICIATLKAAIVCIGLRLSTRREALPPVQATLQGDTCSLTWDSLQLKAAARPGKLAEIEEA